MAANWLVSMTCGYCTAWVSCRRHGKSKPEQGRFRGHHSEPPRNPDLTTLRRHGILGKPNPGLVTRTVRAVNQGQPIFGWWSGVESALRRMQPMTEEAYWFIVEGMLSACWLEEPVPGNVLRQIPRYTQRTTR